MVQKPQPKKPVIRFSLYWMYAIIILVLAGMLYMDNNAETKRVDYTRFEQLVRNGSLEKIVVVKGRDLAEGYLTPKAAKQEFPDYKGNEGVKYKVTADTPSATKFQDMIDSLPENKRPTVEYEKSSEVSSYLWTFGPVILLIAFWFWMMRRMSGKDNGAGGVFSVGKSKAKIFDKDGPIQVTFKDVAGLNEEKEELEEILQKLSKDDSYGMILRSKGILQTEDGSWIQFDLVPGEYEIREGSADYTGRICVIGSKLKEDELEGLFF